MTRVADVRWAPIIASTSGDNTVIPARLDTRFRVLCVTLVCSAAVGVAWKSGSIVKIPAMSFAQNGGMDINRPGPGTYFMETEPGDPLIANLSTTANVIGSLNYVEIPED